MLAKPDAFLSYTRFDDKKHRISEFRSELSYVVQSVSGEPFDIFQDIDDEDGIALGKKWQDVLDEMLDRARFFIPILTPSFFMSQPCRDELSKFLELEEKAGRHDLVLPIYWIGCPVLEEPHLKAQDELAQAIDERQRWDWRKFRHRSIDSAEVAEQLEALGTEIERARRSVLRVVESPKKAVGEQQAGRPLSRTKPFSQKSLPDDGEAQERAEEEKRRKAKEAAEAEARKKAEEEERKRAEEEKRRKVKEAAEAEARKKAEEEKRRKAKEAAEAALAEATGIEPAMTRKSLYLLGEEGVVRELDRAQNIWEISHDFVARQLGQIIPRLKAIWWQQAQKAATPVALVAGLVILGAGWPIYQRWENARIADDLRAQGVHVLGEKGAYDITIDHRTDAEAIDRIVAHLEKLNPVSLTINNNDQLQALPPLDGLAALTSLGIWNNPQLQALPPLKRNTKLNIVRIGGNGDGKELPELGDLNRLEVVGFYADDIEATIEALKGLPATTVIETTQRDPEAFAERLNAARAKLGLPPAKVARWGTGG